MLQYILGVLGGYLIGDAMKITSYSKGGQFNDKELLAKYKKGESIGFSAIAHLKAKGLIPRADGTKRKSEKYKYKEGGKIWGHNPKKGSNIKYSEGGETNKYLSDEQIDKLNKLELVNYISKIDPFKPLFTRRSTTKNFREIAKKITHDKINKKYADGGEADADFDKYKSVFKKWLSSDLELEFLSKGSTNDAPKEFIERRKRILEQTLQNKKELDELIKNLESKGYNTSKMWRDMYNKKTLGDESIYKKFMEDGGMMDVRMDGGLIKSVKSKYSDLLWESVKIKFSEVFFEEDDVDEIYSNQVKAEEYQWQFDRYSKYPSSLSWEDAKSRFLGMLTAEEKKIISIEYDVKDIHELFGVMSEKKILVKRIVK